MIETHKSLVGHIECDANAHMNVANYVRRFSEAGQNLFAMHGANAIRYNPANRHFRFHREMEADSRALVLSVQIGAGDHCGQVLHVMQDADRNTVTATCIDSDFECLPERLPVTRGGPPSKAKPRGITAGRYEPVDTDALLSMRQAIVAHRNRVLASECTGDGIMTDGDLVARFFESATQLWAYAGFEPLWFKDNDYGGAAVEMKLTHHAPIHADVDYAIVSWVPGISAKMLPLSNQLISVPDGNPLASISAVSIVMDRKSRLPVEFPAELRAKHESRFPGIANLVSF
ncbi:thioesterase family protein [Hoeflea sp. TYP-13]|uniref:thioesterase family protein n=1 Tax=Hoeflea sp. TYP-13 TaxID=3230023 RepID=UPI0034C603DC